MKNSNRNENSLAHSAPIRIRSKTLQPSHSSSSFTSATKGISPPSSSGIDNQIHQNPEWDALLEEKEEDMIYNDDGLIKGGTIESMVRTITNPKFTSNKCLNAFLLTYRAFATPLQLLQLLITRFHVKSSRSQDPEFKKYFEERKRKPIQLR